MDLSIVVASRNDGHGGEQAERHKLFLDSIDRTFVDLGIETEVIFVEWNRGDYPPLVDILEPQRYPVWIIEADTEIHRSVQNWEQIPFFQMIAKNVGLRRSNGEWILATNPDIIFERGIGQRFEAGLNPNCFYRVPRCDVHVDVLDVPTDRDPVPWLQNQPSDRNTQLWEDGLFTMACGDFTLMNRLAWEDLRGYPEYGKWSIHNDSLFLAQAVTSGYMQVIWQDCSVYHVDHGASWSTEPEYGNDKPQLTLKAVSDAFSAMQNWMEFANSLGPGIRPYCGFNDINWGKCSSDLKVTARGP